MTTLVVQDWGIQPYKVMCDAMQDYTAARDVSTRDQLWLVQHPAIYTLGTAAKREHLLRETAIPVVQCNRGGQVTYHGLGQQIFYVLLDLKRKNLTVRQLVTGLEQVIINVLANYNIASYSSKTAPGVYIDGRKISSLGLKIQHGCSFHGIALNLSMDLTPFNDINPCGYAGLEVVNLGDLVPEVSNKDVCQQFIELFCDHFDYKIEKR